MPLVPQSPNIIQPDATTYSPYEGQDLNRFFQNWFVGLTNLSTNSVLTEYQSEPPIIPQAGVAWCSFKYERIDSNEFPFIKHESSFDLIQNHEMFKIHLTFYDLGTNGQASYLAALVRDNIKIPWNVYYLQNNGFNLRGTEGPIVIPVIFKQRWMYKELLYIYVMRNCTRQYNVYDVDSVNIELITSSDLILNGSVEG
jgi:hypothetical protein